MCARADGVERRPAGREPTYRAPGAADRPIASRCAGRPPSSPARRPAARPICARQPKSNQDPDAPVGAQIRPRISRARARHRQCAKAGGRPAHRADSMRPNCGRHTTREPASQRARAREILIDKSARRAADEKSIGNLLRVPAALQLRNASFRRQQRAGAANSLAPGALALAGRPIQLNLSLKDLNLIWTHAGRPAPPIRFISLNAPPAHLHAWPAPAPTINSGPAPASGRASGGGGGARARAPISAEQPEAGHQKPVAINLARRLLVCVAAQLAHWPLLARHQDARD